MAFIKLSGLITDMKGKLNGSYFQTKKGSVSMNTINTNNKSKNSTNLAVNIAKSNLSQASKSWKLLSSASQLVWDAYASTLTRTNKNGQNYTPTGYQIFCEASINMKGLALNVPTNPVDSAVSPNLNLINVQQGAAPDKFTLENTNTASTGFYINVFATRPQSKGVKYARGSYKKIGSYLGNIGSEDLTSAYNDAFGFISAGTPAFFKIEIITISNGVKDGSKLTKADAG